MPHDDLTHHELQLVKRRSWPNLVWSVCRMAWNYSLYIPALAMNSNHLHRIYQSQANEDLGMICSLTSNKFHGRLQSNFEIKCHLSSEKCLRKYFKLIPS